MGKKTVFTLFYLLFISHHKNKSTKNNNNNKMQQPHHNLPPHVLMQHNAHIDRTQHEKNMALYNACLKKHVPVIKEILLHPTKININDLANNIKVQYEVKANPNFVNFHAGGWTPLLLAASANNGTGPVVRLMLNQLFENICNNLFASKTNALPPPNSRKYDPEQREFEMRGQSKLLFKHRPWMEEMATRFSETRLNQFPVVPNSQTSALALSCQNGCVDVVKEICDFVSMGNMPQVNYSTSFIDNNNMEEKEDKEKDDV